MGIRYLNRFIKSKCVNSIHCVHLSALTGKCIVIDASIYLYNYESEDALIENFYLMLSIFRCYNITPLFIFDGKPPPDKKELLLKRKQKREQYQEKYRQLNIQITQNTNDDEMHQINQEMNKLKKKLVQMTKNKIEKVKNLIQVFGASWIDAPEEADKLCVLLVKEEKAWACLSEDMDLFVYGCPRVLRYFSLLKHTAVLYNTSQILKELNMPFEDFKDICVLSGTDYNILNNRHNALYIVLSYYTKYKKSTCNESFYEWLVNNTSFICQEDVEVLNGVKQIFTLNDTNKEQINQITQEQIIQVQKQFNQEALEQIMNKENFIFVKNKS